MLCRHENSFPPSRVCLMTATFEDCGDINRLLNPGRYLTDFTEISVLGRGGFGQVFRVEHRIDGQHYAVKRIRIPSAWVYTAQTAKIWRLVREVRSLAATSNHAGIIRYHQAWLETAAPKSFSQLIDGARESVSFSTDSIGAGFEESQTNQGDYSFSEGVSHSISSYSRSTKRENSLIAKTDENNKNSTNIPNSTPLLEWFLFIQTELCENHTLADYLSNRKEVEFEKSVRIANEIFNAVQHIHSSNVVHRDLKPTNIFFGKDSRVRVGDFGLSSFLNSNDNIPEPLKTCLSSSNEEFGKTTEIGTAPYSSPEQSNRNSIYPVTVKSDIYSLGIILIELFHLMGTRMERAHILSQTRVSGLAPIELKKFPQIYDIINSCLLNDPDKRPAISVLLNSQPFFVENDLIQKLKEELRLTRVQLAEKDSHIQNLEQKLNNSNKGRKKGKKIHRRPN
eukprot:c15306_g1_i1.p1 GENE.c15306_g1_i1~~c15306_g1_i1.p1  ORF type:complete len:470 (-),score=175.62 c15306_g1_i1:29-1384(-)